MIRQTIVAVSAIVLCSVAPALATPSYSAIYAFGDSLSDAGNLFIATGGAEPASPYFNGEFSNGPVWVQDLSVALGLGPLTPSVIGGTDYAWGGATTGNPTSLYPPSNPLSTVPTLQDQVGLFSLAHSSVAPSNALYTFSIGANDLFSILGQGLSAPAAFAAAAGAAAVVADEAGALESEGAKRLVLFDVPNLGLTPEVTADGPTAIAAATALSRYFDQQVLADLKPVETAGLKVYDLNTFTLINEVVKNPSAYGFTNVTSPCYPGTFMGGGGYCSTPDSYLFWDHLHPTAAAQAIIGDIAYNQVTTAPEISTWVMMLLGFAGLGVARRRSTGARQRLQ